MTSAELPFHVRWDDKVLDVKFTGDCGAQMVRDVRPEVVPEVRKRHGLGDLIRYGRLGFWQTILT